MDTPALLAVAAQRCTELPGTHESQPFGDGADVWKVQGKVFALLARGERRHPVTLKVDPFEAEILRHTHPEIRPGHHMNKRHWITLYAGDLGEEVVRDLVTDSYLLVVAGLPKARRPVDPETFGQE